MLSVPQMTGEPASAASIENTAGCGSTRTCTCRRASSTMMRSRCASSSDRLFWMIDDVVREIGLVVEDQRDAVLAGNVGCGDDRELVPGNGRIEVDAEDAPARHVAADRRAVAACRAA